MKLLIKHIQVIIFLILVSVAITLCNLFPNAATNPESGLVLWLPEKISGGYSELREMSDVEEKILPTDTTKLSRLYLEFDLPENLARYRAISATLILAGADKRSLHKPEICLISQGWSIVSAKPVKLQTTGGELEVMHLRLSREMGLDNGEGRQQRAHYIYWWVARYESTAFSNKRLLISSYNNIFNNLNDRWGYPSIMVLTDERYGDEGDTEAISRAYLFIKKYAPSFQKSLGAIDRSDALVPIDLGNLAEWK